MSIITRIRDRIAQFRTWFTSLSLFKQMLAWLFFIVVVMGFASLAIDQGFWGEKRGGKLVPYVNPMDAIRQGPQCIPNAPGEPERCCECHPNFCKGK